MQTAAASTPQSTQWAQIIDGYAHLHQLLARASSADPKGPYGKAIADAEKAFNWLVAQRSSDNQTSDPQAMAAQYPAAFSADQISPEVQQNPSAYLQDGDYGSVTCLNYASDGESTGVSSDPECDPSSDGGTVAGYQDDYYAYTADQETGGDGGVSSSSSNDIAGSADGGTIQGYTPAFQAAVADRRADYGVSDRRAITTDPSIESGNPRVSGPIVRDHMPLPPPAEMAAAPLDGESGTAFTSASTFADIRQARADYDAARQYALQHPDDPEAAQRAQDAALAYQLKTAAASQDSAMEAQQVMDALKASKLQA